MAESALMPSAAFPSLGECGRFVDPVTAGYLNELRFLLETCRVPQSKLFLNPTQFQEVFHYVYASLKQIGPHSHLIAAKYCNFKCIYFLGITATS